jgi:hypothetical protein
VAPGTVAPWHPAPGTVAPGTVAPGTVAPGTVARGTVAPGTVALGTPAPGNLCHPPSLASAALASANDGSSRTASRYSAIARALSPAASATCAKPKCIRDGR